MLTYADWHMSWHVSLYTNLDALELAEELLAGIEARG
jgi:hypothetical protein